MPTSALPDQFHTVEEYLLMEAESEVRLEYHSGHVYAMAGGTMVHNDIAGNLYTMLRNQRTTSCRVRLLEAKLEVQLGKFYVYPDVVLTCHPDDAQNNQIIKNPCILIEILSKSTSEYDRGTKLKEYLKLPSLEAYLLVDQYHVLVECYQRKGDFFQYSFYEQLSDVVFLDTLAIQFPLQKIYEEITFEDTLAKS